VSLNLVVVQARAKKRELKREAEMPLDPKPKTQNPKLFFPYV